MGKAQLYSNVIYFTNSFFLGNKIKERPGRPSLGKSMHGNVRGTIYGTIILIAYKFQIIILFCVIGWKRNLWNCCFCKIPRGLTKHLE